MGIYTNEGVVKHAEKALNLKTKYMWGGILAPVEKYYDLLFKTYGIDAAKGYTAARWNELAALKNKGVYAVDCVGLIKSYYWSGKADGGTGSPKYCSAEYPDVGAGTMYQRAKVKGKIDTMPETKGIIVISRKHGNHVGVYIGGGYTIESTLGNRGDGVVKHKLDKSFWTDWFECPYIEYKKTPAEFSVGDKVTIKETATTYAGVSTKIPAGFKGSKQVYTVSKVLGEKVLLKELYSWVWNKDLNKI